MLAVTGLKFRNINFNSVSYKTDEARGCCILNVHCPFLILQMLKSTRMLLAVSFFFSAKRVLCCVLFPSHALRHFHLIFLHPLRNLI